MGVLRISTLLALTASLTLASSVFARDAMAPKPGELNETPKELEGIGITERLGEKVDLDAPFTDQNGDTVTLRSYMRDGKPVLLSLAYYSCPSLCNFHLNGLLDAFKKMKQPLGEEFNAVVVSIEPKETPQLAKDKRANYLKEYARPEGEKGWHFLVGAQGSIDRITKDVGFSYRWDEEQQQYAHAAAAFVITPEGEISRYLYGIVFDPKTIRLSMVEASKGGIGSVVDRLILFCYHYDPKTSQYALMASNIMRAGGVAIVLALTMVLAPFWIRNSRKVQGEA